MNQDLCLIHHVLKPSRNEPEIDTKPETVNLLKDNVGKVLGVIGIEKNFLNINSIAQKILKINKWDYFKLRSFCTAKETISKLRRQPSK